MIEQRKEDPKESPIKDQRVKWRWPWVLTTVAAMASAPGRAAACRACARGAWTRPSGCPSSSSSPSSPGHTTPTLSRDFDISTGLKTEILGRYVSHVIDALLGFLIKPGLSEHLCSSLSTFWRDVPTFLGHGFFYTQHNVKSSVDSTTQVSCPIRANILSALRNSYASSRWTSGTRGSPCSCSTTSSSASSSPPTGRPSLPTPESFLRGNIGLEGS